jgi:hypothetical protein
VKAEHVRPKVQRNIRCYVTLLHEPAAVPSTLKSPGEDRFGCPSEQNQ